MIKPHSCPICDQTFSADSADRAATFPFCSERCRQVDLLRWCDGRYAVVEDLDPMVAEFLKHDPDIVVQGEGVSNESGDDA
ncbi:MAG: DNA gyrase inhibitor YacG [Planctomycetaceae bacterium]